MSNAAVKENPQFHGICLLCGDGIYDRTNRSLEARPVHNGCFDRREAGHIRGPKVTSDGHQMRRNRKRALVGSQAISDSSSLRDFARTTEEGRAWLARKAVL